MAKFQNGDCTQYVNSVPHTAVGTIVTSVSFIHYVSPLNGNIFAICGIDSPEPYANAAGRENCQTETPVAVKLAMDAHADEVSKEGGMEEAFDREAFLYSSMTPAYDDSCVGVHLQLTEQWAGAAWHYTQACSNVDSDSALWQLKNDWNTNSLHSNTVTEMTYGLITGNKGGCAWTHVLGDRTLAYGVGTGNNGGWNEWYIMAHEVGHNLGPNHAGKEDTNNSCGYDGSPYWWQYLHTPGHAGDKCRYMAWSDDNAGLIRDCVEYKSLCT